MLCFFPLLEQALGLEPILSLPFKEWEDAKETAVGRRVCEILWWRKMKVKRKWRKWHQVCVPMLPK